MRARKFKLLDVSARDLRRHQQSDDRPARPSRSKMACVVLACSSILAGCAGTGAPAISTPATSSTPTSLTTHAPDAFSTISSSREPFLPCPTSDDGVCLGIPAGTYATVRFDIPLAYTVPPGGWSVYEDTRGAFLLAPGGFDRDGIDTGTADYIGIYARIAASDATCSGEPAAGVGAAASEIADELASRPGLTTTTPRPVSIGGLDGVELDIRMAENWTEGCAYWEGGPVIPLIVGLAPSGLDHSMILDQATRLYLLDRSDYGTLVIEVTDVSGGSRLDSYSPIVKQIEFEK